MKKYSIKNFSTNKLLLYSIISFIVTVSLTILTSLYVEEKIYPGIVFIFLIIISILFIKNNCWNLYNISINTNNNSIQINNKQYDLIDIDKYAVNDTEHFYGFRLFIGSKCIFLNVPKKNSLDYLKFKTDFIEIIKYQNKEEQNKITEYDWYKTKSAKIYGYIILFVMILWVVIMLIYPEKLKITNLGLFLAVSVGLFPILFKIFRNDKSI